MNPVLRSLRTGFAAVLLVCGVSSCDVASVERPEHWRFALEEPVGSVQHAYALKFKERIEAGSNGRIRVTIYPYGALGTSDQITEQLQFGAVQFAMASPGHLGKIIPEIQVFLLHFMLSSNADVNRSVLEHPAILEAVDALYAEKGMQLLSIYSEGWQAWTTQKPIREPADFQGVKMRVMTSSLLMAAYEAYGASPTPLPYSEVYSALQLSMIDGQVNPIFAIEEMSFYEVTDWLIMPQHAPFITSAVASRPFFEQLSPESQTLVRETVTALNDEIAEIQRDYNKTRLKIIRQQKPELEILTLSDSERQQFRSASLPVRQQFDAMAGPRGRDLRLLLQETVDAALRDAAHAEARLDDSKTNTPSS